MTRSTAQPVPAPQERTGRERLAAVGSLLVLLALLIGLPAALALLVGWPLPDHVLTGSELSDAARSPITDTMVVNALACVFWLAWLQIVVCTVIEVRAAVTGVGVPRSVPLAGVTQHLTRKLVSSVLLLATATAVLSPATAAVTRAVLGDGPQTSVSAAATVDTAISQQAPPTSDRSGPDVVPMVKASPAAAADATRPAGELVGRKVLVVAPPDGRHHMSLWEIAENHLGDGLRYKEIFQLNDGRTQPAGGTLAKARLIQPGWQLLMPDDAVGVPVVAAPAAHGSLVAPAVTTTTGAAAEAPGLPASAPVPATASATVAATSSTDTALVSAQTQSPLVSVLALAEAGLLSAGLLAGLRTLRTVQRRRRGDGERVPTPTEELVRAEIALRVGETPETVRELDRTLRLLSVRQSAAGGALPDVVAAIVYPESLRLVLAEPQRPVPAPFVGTDPLGSGWYAPRAASDDPWPSALSPYPALVSVGGDDEGSHLLVDLEAVGVLGLSGPRRQTDAALRALAVELATSGWADHLTLTLVGFGAGLVPLRPSRVRHVATLAEALPRLEARVQALAPHGDGPQGVLRSRTGDHDPVMPEIVLIAEQDAPAAEDLQRLRALTRDLRRRSGLAVVTSEDVPDGSWQLRLTADGMATAQPLGAAVRSRALDDDTWQAVLALVAAAARPAEPVDTVPAPAAEPADAPDDPQAVRRLPSLAEVTLGTLGPVDPGGLALVPPVPFDGELCLLGGIELRLPGVGPAPHAHCLELLVLLALHPEGVLLPAIAEALQPLDEPEQAQRDTQVLVARTRSWLGSDSAGMERLPHVEAGQPLRISLALDVDRFRQAAGAGRLDDDALALLRGPVLSGLPPRRYSWLVRTGLEDELPALVVDAVAREATARLDSGDFSGARTAAEAGLRVEHLDERLWRALLRAVAGLGDTQRIGQLADQLTDLLARRLSPYDDLQPETEVLLAELLGGSEQLAR